jgi:hypothetical protein
MNGKCLLCDRNFFFFFWTDLWWGHLWKKYFLHKLMAFYPFWKSQLPKALKFYYEFFIDLIEMQDINDFIISYILVTEYDLRIWPNFRNEFCWPILTSDSLIFKWPKSKNSSYNLLVTLTKIFSVFIPFNYDLE